MRVPRQITSPYHVIHYIILTFYFVYLYPHYLRPLGLSTPHGEKRLLEMGLTSLNHEKEVIGMVCMSFLLKLKRCRTFDEVLERLLTHFKILSVLLTFMTSQYYFMTGMILFYFTLMIVLTPPKYQGSTEVTPLNPHTFASMVRLDHDKSTTTTRLILFGTNWASDCRFVEPMYASLSVTYTSNGVVQFHSLDLDRYPEIASEFNIDITTKSKQLPTIILFYRGREVRRLPPFDENGKVVPTMMDKKGLIKYFELDKDPDEASYRRNNTYGGKSNMKKNSEKKKNS